MSDPLAPVVRGQPVLPIGAQTYNLVMDTVRRDQQRRIAGPDAGIPGLPVTRPELLVFVVNSTGATLPPFSIMEITSSDGDMNNVPYAMRDQPLFVGSTPAATYAPQYQQLAITYDTIPNSQLGRCVAEGHAQCQILMNLTTDQWANPIAGDNTKLSSASYGQVRIIRVNNGNTYTAGTVQNAEVMLSSPRPLLACQAGMGDNYVAPPSAGDCYTCGTFTIATPGRYLITLNTGFLLKVTFNTTGTSSTPDQSLGVYASVNVGGTSQLYYAMMQTLVVWNDILSGHAKVFQNQMAFTFLYDLTVSTTFTISLLIEDDGSPYWDYNLLIWNNGGTNDIGGLATWACLGPAQVAGNCEFYLGDLNVPPCPSGSASGSGSGSGLPPIHVECSSAKHSCYVPQRIYIEYVLTGDLYVIVYDPFAEGDTFWGDVESTFRLSYTCSTDPAQAFYWHLYYAWGAGTGTITILTDQCSPFGLVFGPYADPLGEVFKIVAIP